jgi:hypothetical protein
LNRLRGISHWHDTTLWPQIAFALLLAVVTFALPVRFYIETLNQRQFEQNEEGLDLVVHYIERYSKPGDTIVSDPYYAFVSRRFLAEEYSELFLWTLKYSLECEALLLQKKKCAAGSACGTIVPGRGGSGRASGCSNSRRVATQSGRVSKCRSAFLRTQVRELLACVNYTLRVKPLYSPAVFARLDVPEAVKTLAASNPIGADRARLNRLLFEAVYPDLVEPSMAARQPDGEGIRKVKAIAERLRARNIPIVIASTSPDNLQVLRSEEIRSAVEAFYKPLIPEDDPVLTGKMRTLNFQMQIFLPRSDEEMRKPADGQES